MKIAKQRNKNSLERITFHLDQAMRFSNQLDLSGLTPPEQNKWDKGVKICKNAIGFSKESVQKPGKIIG